jgi:hypothetical protein
VAEALAAPPDTPTAPDGDGTSSTRLAEQRLLDAGFEIVQRNARIRGTGVTVSFVARDGAGATWLFDVAGAHTSHRGGLQRTDVAWRALGRAAALRSARGEQPLVLLTSHLPRRGTDADTALRAAGPEIVHDVIDLLDQAALTRLARYAAGGHVRHLPS